MGTSHTLFLYLFTAVSLVALTPAFAEDVAPAAALPTKVYVHRTYEHQQTDRNDHIYTPNLGRAGEMVISDNDKVSLGKYLAHNYKNTCAWEHDYHAKKCVAPAPQKRTYMIGYALPSDAVSEDVPAKVTAYLRPIPDGYKYVRVGNNVVLINAESREVVDDVTLLSTYTQ